MESGNNGEKQSGAAAAAKRGGHVLVMDDEETLRAVCAAILEKLGYRVETTSDGAAAIARYQEALDAGDRFDAVILDLTIPVGMGGQETLDALRAIDPAVCAIASSGDPGDPAMLAFRDRGFVGVLPKPYRLEELQRVIGNVADSGQPATG